MWQHGTCFNFCFFSMEDPPCLWIFLKSNLFVWHTPICLLYMSALPPPPPPPPRPGGHNYLRASSIQHMLALYLSASMEHGSKGYELLWCHVCEFLRNPFSVKWMGSICHLWLLPSLTKYCIIRPSEAVLAVSSSSSNMPAVAPKI